MNSQTKEIEDFFKLHKNITVAFSGGVDSAVLLFLAKKYAQSVCAVYVKSDFQPQFELEDAKKLCLDLNTELNVIELDVLGNDEINANPADRCYYCKKDMFTSIIAFADINAAGQVVEGTNFSDDVSDRPGYKALNELGVLSPLRSCGYTKSDIRRLAFENGIFVHNKPSYACLATRVPTGTQITKDILHKTEGAENELFNLGFTDFRIRYLNGAAKIQVKDDQLGLALKNKDIIINKLNPYYDDILLDLKGR